MKTTLYMIRHGATESNLANPPVLQGRGRDQPLALLGVRQAKITRDFLALQRFDAVYSSPMQRALQTAELIAAPQELAVQKVEEFTECDVGAWEGMSWDIIERQYQQEYQQYMQDPATHGYLGGETFADVHARTSRAVEDILSRHEGETVMVVAHHVVSRVYLAGVLGLPPEKGRQVSLGNCSISIVQRKDGIDSLKTLNSLFHLQGIAA